MIRNIANPHARFIMWLMVLNKLSTLDKIEMWKLNVDDTCKLRSSVPETTEHVLSV